MANGNGNGVYKWIAGIMVAIVMSIFGWAATDTLSGVRTAAKGNTDSIGVVRDSVASNSQRITGVERKIDSTAQAQQLRDTLMLLQLRAVAKRLNVEIIDSVGDSQ